MDAISVIMPYFNRREVLEETLEGYRLLYGADVEIVIVDDGSSKRLEPIAGAKVINLPRKDEGRAPVVAFNIGVEYAEHDIIAISLPEVLHGTQTLYEMRELCEEGCYVIAPCWCESTGRWVAAPNVEPKEGQQHYKPRGVGFNFCVMFRRALWNSIGGMSREYRHGSHFEDTDFAWKVKKSGASIRWAQSHVTHTRKNGAHANWVKGGWERNRGIFLKEWECDVM